MDYLSEYGEPKLVESESHITSIRTAFSFLTVGRIMTHGDKLKNLKKSKGSSSTSHLPINSI